MIANFCDFSFEFLYKFIKPQVRGVWQHFFCHKFNSNFTSQDAPLYLIILTQQDLEQHIFLCAGRPRQTYSLIIIPLKANQLAKKPLHTQ